MSSNFFTNPGKFYRGNLHTHSNLSDGVLDPEEVCRRYQAEGYDFITLSDHFIGLYDYPIADTTAFRNDKFTTILGAELHTGIMENGTIWHILASGLPVDFAKSNAPTFATVEGSETSSEITKRALDAGAFVAIAHPHWSGMNEADAQTMTAAHAVEVYNHGCATDSDRGEGFVTLEYLLNKGHRLNLIATDDAHFATLDHFGGWVMVKAAENTPEALLEALKKGAFYSSLGPDFHDIRMTEEGIEVDCTAVQTIILTGEGTRSVVVCGEAMTAGKLSFGQLTGSPWLRVSIIDRAGKRAWSNPIWMDG